MIDRPTQEHTPEILNNGIIGLQDRLDDLNLNLEHIHDRLESLNEILMIMNDNLKRLRND